MLPFIRVEVHLRVRLGSGSASVVGEELRPPFRHLLLAPNATVSLTLPQWGRDRVRAWLGRAWAQESA
jgi:hypothetical protein